MNDIIQFIFLFLIGTTVINFGMSILARFKTGNKEFNQLSYYWISLFVTYAAVATLSKNPTQIAFAYFFQFIPAFIKTKFLRDSRGIASNWKFFFVAQLAGMVFSAFLLLYTKVGFTISLLPVTFTTCIPYWRPVWNTLFSHRKEANWIEKGLGVVLLSSIINHFNYAFFRLDEAAAWWGWSVSIAQYQAIMIFLPLLINHRRESNEVKNLKHALTKLSKQSVHSAHSEDLYQQLEIQISQKELFYKQLQDTNKSLEEEREMNEMLIRTISHDLANPLTVISAYIEILHGEKVKPEDTEKIWSRLRTNTKSALDMISRIRNAIITRNQASYLGVHDVAIDRSIKRSVDQFENRLKEKNLTLNYTNEVPLDTFVDAEENALCEHVFANILSNAIKFSYLNSSIEIIVTEKDSIVLVEFIDHGTGIQDSRLEKRILTSTQGTNGEVGTGFGLMVMGHFLRTFGATIQISSKTTGPSKGTRVSIGLNKSSLNKNQTITSPMKQTAHLY